MKKKILGVLLTLACMISVFPTSVFAEELTTEITEVGSTSSSVSMTYEDEHRDYIPTDNFTVTIPKTFSVNPKEDYVYDVNVQGTIDADRDVWVCTDDTVTLTLTDETLAATYGINKTQTVANTIDKIQYSSEEIADAEGYTQQGTIHKSSLNYEIEAEYAGTLNFYINVINENNIIPGTIQQNGYMTCTAEDLIAIIKDYVPEHIFNHYEERITSECNGRAVHDTQNNCSLIIGKEKNTYWDSSKSENFIAYNIVWYPTENKTSSTVTKKSIITNGKYYYTYKYYIPASSTYSSSMSLRYYPTSNTYDIATSSGESKWGSDVTITTTDTMSAELYLSPRCKLIYE